MTPWEVGLFTVIIYVFGYIMVSSHFDIEGMCKRDESLFFRHYRAAGALWPVLIWVGLFLLARAGVRILAAAAFDIADLVRGMKAQYLPPKAAPERIEPTYYPDPPMPGAYRKPPTCPRCGQPCAETSP